jgi:hypothetical protein
MVVMEYGRVTIETDVASLDAILHEIGWPHAFAGTGAPLHFRFSSSSARSAVQRRLKDANYVLVESKAGRGEIRLYPDERGGQLAAFTPSPRDPSSLGPTSVRRAPGTDAGLAAGLREQFYTAGSPAERARALDELALHADEDVIREIALEILGREQHDELLESALEALDRVRVMPVRPLLDFIARERRNELRVQAIELLGRHGGGDVSARDLLARISTSREDESVRRAARGALDDLTASR